MSALKHIADAAVLRARADLANTDEVRPEAHRKETRPRVLQVVSGLHLGGSEEVCFSIMQRLRSEYQFGVFAVRGISDCKVGRNLLNRATEMGVPVYSGTRLPQKFGGMLTGGIALVQTIRKRKPALIHVHTEDSEANYAMAATLFPSIRSIPLVRTIHNTTLWPRWSNIGRWCQQRLTHAYVACVSESTEKAFIANWQPHCESVVIYNGVVMQCPHRGADDKSQLRILFAGRFVEQKGVRLLPAIVRAVRPPAGSVYDLSIHGAGPYRPLLEALATNPPPGWRIRVDGPLPGLANALPKFDLVLMPSLYEGLGLTAVESLLAGVPVVATAAPGLTEVFPSDYPWLAPPDDADSFAKVLSRAIAERSRWGETVATSADFARNRFDVSAMCRAYARLYADAVASPAPKTDRQHARSEP